MKWKKVWKKSELATLEDLQNRVFIVRIRSIWFWWMIWGDVKKIYEYSGVNYWGFRWGHFKIRHMKDGNVVFNYDMLANRFVRCLRDTVRKSLYDQADFIGEARLRLFGRYWKVFRFTLKCIEQG